MSKRAWILAVGLVLRTRDAAWGATSLGLFEATSGVAAAAGALIALQWRPPDPTRAGLLMLVAQAMQTRIAPMPTRGVSCITIRAGFAD